MENMQYTEQDLLMKESRVDYWEKFHSMPSNDDLMAFQNTGVEL